MKRANAKWHIGVDYRRLNGITIKDKYLLPLRTTWKEQVDTSHIFAELELKLLPNLQCIVEGGEWKIAFETWYGLYEYWFMSFGLTNTPSCFQWHLNNILAVKINRGVVVYIHDILIYSKTEVTDIESIRWILQNIMEHILYINIDKCLFHISEVDFRGFQVGK